MQFNVQIRMPVTRGSYFYRSVFESCVISFPSRSFIVLRRFLEPTLDLRASSGDSFCVRRLDPLHRISTASIRSIGGYKLIMYSVY